MFCQCKQVLFFFVVFFTQRRLLSHRNTCTHCTGQERFINTNKFIKVHLICSFWLLYQLWTLMLSRSTVQKKKSSGFKLLQTLSVRQVFFFYCRDPEHSHFRKMALAWTQKPRPPDVSSLLVGRDSQSRERFVLKEETLKQPIADKGHTKMLNQRLVWEIWIIFEMGIIQSYSKGVELKTSVTDQCRKIQVWQTSITILP